jgi:nitroreductase
MTAGGIVASYGFSACTIDGVRVEVDVEFFDVVEKRRSVRCWEGRPVEEEKLRKILEAANRAPSAGNLQAYEIYVARSAEHRDAIARACAQQYVACAPIVLVFCIHPERSAAKYGARSVRIYCLQDAAGACTFAMLAAVALGLACVWVGTFDAVEMRRIAGAPEGVLPVALLPIGYAAEDPPLTPRRALTELVHELT